MQRDVSVLFTCRIVLEIESIESMERVVRMHIQRVDGQIIGCEVERHEHLAQREEPSISEYHCLVGVPLQLVLDEAQQMLLVHARRVVHVRVHLAAVVEVPVWY